MQKALGRDVLLRRRIRLSLRVTLLRVRCPNCNYLLLGQRANDGAVICPECGRKTLLIDLGITEADLIPPMEASVPLLRHD